MDCFVATAPRNDVKTERRLPAARCARGMRENFRALKSEGAGNAGCALHPRSRVQTAQKTHTSIQGSGGDPTFPAQWFYGLLRALPGDRACLPPSPPRRFASRELDASVGASGPHGFAVRVGATRLKAPK